MKKLFLLFVLFASICTTSFSQITFEHGYLIDNSNQKTECLIKNIDWASNPTEFEYKLSENASVQKASIDNTREFGIDGISKYIRANVKIDKSSDQVGYLTSDSSPDFQKDQLFLEVLIEGKASLYQYDGGNLKRFFYSSDHSEIEQLIYKPYLTDGNIAKNNQYKQQLFSDLKCQTVSQNAFKNLNYSKKKLEKLFIQYNECQNASFKNYGEEVEKDFFNLSLRPGINFSSLDIHNEIVNSRNVAFEDDINFRFGIEAELILPFNKDKWGLFIEPTYQYYTSENVQKSDKVVGGLLVSQVNYQSIELPVGVRYYLFINEDSKFFVDISYLFDVTINSSIEFKRSNGTSLSSYDLKSSSNIGLGLGYKYLDKYSLSLRYQTDQDILGDYASWDTNYQTYSVIFGYSLF